MKENPSVAGKREISGAIVKRQQKTKKDEDDGDGDVGSPRQKKKQKKEPEVARTPADAAKDTAEKFEYVLRHGILDAQAQNPGKVVVVLIDGGGPHTCEPFLSLRPSKMTSSGIEAELRVAGLWPSSSPTAAQAKRIYTDSPIPRKQWTNAELIALELGAIVVYIPLNQPHLNVIEQVWRAVKQRYRMKCAVKNLKNMLESATDSLTGAPGAESVCSTEALMRRDLRTELISRHLAENPDADPLKENKLRGSKFQPSPPVDVSAVPKIGLFRRGTNLLAAQQYAHFLNQARLKQYRRGEVSCFCELCKH